MQKVLVINASPRGNRSHSRKLTDMLVKSWQSKDNTLEFIHREVGKTAIPHITEAWIAAAFKAPALRTTADNQVLELSDELVQELKDASIYVLGVPMHNWSIPSGLKAYIDQVMRINETWKFYSGKPDGHYVGLLENKKMYILSSRGDNGYEVGEFNAHMNFQTTYLRHIFGIMGVKDIDIISLNNEEYGDERFVTSQEIVHQKIAQLEVPRETERLLLRS